MNKNKNIVTKKHFVENIKEDLDIDLKSAKKLYDSFFDTFIKSLKSKKDIKVANLGVFSIIKTKERKGMNLKTNTVILIPSKNKLKFKVSKKLKEEIEQIE